MAVLSQSFDGFDLAALNVADVGLTGSNRIAIKQHRARPALALAAAVLRPRESEVFSENFEQGAPRICRNAVRFSINGKLQVGIHGSTFYLR